MHLKQPNSVPRTRRRKLTKYGKRVNLENHGKGQHHESQPGNKRLICKNAVKQRFRKNPNYGSVQFHMA